MNIIHYISDNLDPRGIGAVRGSAGYLMAYASEGSLALRIAEAPVRLGAGELIFGRLADLSLPLPPAIQAPRSEYCLVLFAAEGEEAELVEGLAAGGVREPKPGLGFAREQFERRLRSASPAMKRSAEHYLLSFIYDFSDPGSGKSGSAALDRHLGDAIAYMKEHLQDEVSLDSLADAINISKTHLVKIFRKELGSSPMRYLTGLRVEASASLLSGTDMTLGQVAERLNFYSDSHFSKVFKKSMGENPSAYRHTYIDSLLSKQKKSFEELEKAYLFIQQLIDATDDLIFFKNVEGRYLGCNAAFCRFAALSREEVMGRTDFDIFPAEMAKGFVENDRIVLQEGRSHHNEEWIRYPDGAKVLVEVSKSPFFGLRREIGGVIGISRDITYRRMAEERLLVAKEEAEKGRRDNLEETLSAFRAISRMGASASTYLSLLQISETDAEKTSIIDRVIRESEALEDFLEALIGIRQTELGSYPLDDALFSPKETMADAADFAADRYPALEASFESSENLPILLRGGKEALLRIVTSLVSHIGSTGARRARFRFEYGDEDEALSFRATDDGPRLLGNRTGLFTLERVERHAKTRGWDANLWLCQDLAEYMGGEWDIANAGEGVVFTASIPMKRGFA